MFQQKEGQKTQEKETQTTLRLCKRKKAHIWGLSWTWSATERWWHRCKLKEKNVADHNIQWFSKKKKTKKNDISHDALYVGKEKKGFNQQHIPGLRSHVVFHFHLLNCLGCPKKPPLRYAWRQELIRDPDPENKQHPWPSILSPPWTVSESAGRLKDVHNDIRRV